MPEPSTTGSGPRVVLVHGAMDRASGFARCLRHLRDLEVVRYDRRGYGRSLAAGPAPLDGHVGDLLAVLDGRPATVVGHSFGGLIALAAAVRCPRLVASVGAYEPPVPWAPWWPGRRGGTSDVDPGDAAERFLRRAIGDRAWERLPAGVRAARRAEGPAMLAELRDLVAAPAFDPAAVRQPALLGHGGDVDGHHARAVVELAGAMPNAAVTVLEGADHGVHLSEPAAFAAFVRRALDLGYHG
ncbi:MAG: alpha/beta hydrolase [Actinobacteria bacterium]|nr:alpha/beta hydrolase [Actinomycetota bacterium]